jgi:hypothetical protein
MRKSLSWLVPLGIGGALVGLIGMVTHGPARRTISLPDGTVLQIRHLGIGADQQWKPRGWVRERLGRILPNRFQRFLGPSNPGCGNSSDTNALFVWTTRYDPRTGQYLEALSPCYAELEDSHGCVFRSWGGSGCGVTVGDQTMWVQGFLFGAFPRRDREVTLLLRDATNLIGTVRLPNPAYRAHPIWPAPAPPLSVTTNDLTITLRSLDVVPASRTDSGAVYPRFTLTRAGEPVADWSVRNWTLADATGNRGWTLCAAETSARVSATLYQTTEAVFPENQLARCRLKVPAAGQHESLGTRFTVGTRSVEFLAIHGPGRYEWTNGVLGKVEPAPSSNEHSSWSERNVVGWRIARLKPFLLLRLTGFADGERLLIRARDQRAHAVPEPMMVGSMDVTEIREFELPPDASELALELIPLAPIHVEFLAALPARTNVYSRIE